GRRGLGRPAPETLRDDRLRPRASSPDRIGSRALAARGSDDLAARGRRRTRRRRNRLLHDGIVDVRARAACRRRLHRGERAALALIACGTAVSNFGLAASQAVLLLFVYRGLHLHPFAAGVALGLGAAGNVVGAALAPAATRRLGTGRALLVATTCEGLGLLLIELALLGAPIVW